MTDERFYYLRNKLKIIEKTLSLRENVVASELIGKAQDPYTHLTQIQLSGTLLQLLQDKTIVQHRSKDLYYTNGMHITCN